MSLDEENAKKVSNEHIHSLHKDDPLFEVLRNTTAGNPIMVKNVMKQPSYWIVPLLEEKRIAGFARVLLNGKIAHLGSYLQSSGSEQNMAVLTGIDSSKAYELAGERIRKGVEFSSEPIFVHDGPIGSEAWLVEVSMGGKPNRWIFVSGQSVYERPAGKTQEGIMK